MTYTHGADLLISKLYLLYIAPDTCCITFHSVMSPRPNRITYFQSKQLHPSKISWSHFARRVKTVELQRCKYGYNLFTYSLDPCPHANQRNAAQLSDPKLSFQHGNTISLTSVLSTVIQRYLKYKTQAGTLCTYFLRLRLQLPFLYI